MGSGRAENYLAPETLEAGAARSAIEQRRTAYAALIRQHEASLLRLAWRLCEGQQDAAQDLVQETFVRGYEAFLEGRFIEGTNARAWLMRILTNLFLNANRRKQKWTAPVDIEKLADQQAPCLRAAAEERPDNILMASTLEEPLERALASLPETLRLCVILVEIESFTYAEAAEILHIPIGTVRSRLFHARRQLYALLYDYAQDRRRV